MGSLGTVAILASLWCSSAEARPAADPLAATESRVRRTVDRASALEQNSQPGRAVFSATEASARFEEALYGYMIADYESAAEDFFILVTTGALIDADLQLDAEWYLAESLFAMGNVSSAETIFKQIAGDSKNPFHDDGVRRLLELYANAGRIDDFKAFYDAQIARGNVKPSDVITYSLGKSFYKQHDLARAKSALLEILPTSPFYRKAHYWLGTIAVVEGDLTNALPLFDEVAGLSVVTAEDRDILDLSLLASARICLEQHRYDDASDRYGKIGGDSKYLADKIYEETWTFITHKEDVRAKLRDDTTLSEEQKVVLRGQEAELLKAAQRGVEIFLLAFPEHPYAPQLRLLDGHLKQHADDWNGALQSYESVIAEYRPIRERFELLATDASAASRYVAQIQQFEEEGAAESDLPPYAFAMLVQDPDLSRAAKTELALSRQRGTVDTSEGIIEEIRGAFDDPTGVPLHQRRIGEIEGMVDGTRMLELDLIELETDRFGGGKKSEVVGLQTRRDALAKRVFSVDGTASLDTDIAALARDVAAARPSDPTLRAELGRFDSWHKDLATHRDSLRLAAADLVATEPAEVGRLKTRFDQETGEVAEQDTDVDALAMRSQEVLGQLTRSGFERMASVFADAAMSADMGIVDVYWATLLKTTDDREKLVTVRKERIDLLDDSFERIRNTLGKE